MTLNNNDIDTFDKLVTWATWQVIEGFTRGEKLRSIVYGITQYAIQWSRDQEEIRKAKEKEKKK